MGQDTATICLRGGTVVDPANAAGGSIRDVWIRGQRIVAAPAPGAGRTVLTMDCSGRVLMPGGIDLHSHIVGPKVNAARMLQPELFAGGTGEGALRAGDWIVPTTGEAGLRYAGMGYTTVMDAAVTPLAARRVHSELEQLPVVDSGFYVLAGNNHRILKAAADRDVATTARFLQWLLDRCGGYAPKVVNPGGVEHWKRQRTGSVRDLDQSIDGWNTTPRSILRNVTEAANLLDLPHPVHIHCNNLGFPGNWETTLETMRSLDGMRAHLAHIQFHSYGGSDPSSIRSQTEQLIDWVNDHPSLSVDVGQVLFGRTTSMTADGPLGHWLAGLNASRWYSADVEVESGCGVSPIEYRDRDLLNSVQWATGLEWYLGVTNPWQIAMTTDHPNGGSFQAYPQIIRLLMDRGYRRERLGQLPPRLGQRTRLAEMDREYTLEEIAIITRAGPARVLGLKDKGHLGPGAVADIAVYTPNANQELMFELPWLVIKSGRVVLENGQQVSVPRGATHVLDRPPQDDPAGGEFESWFADHYSVGCRNLGRKANPERFSRELLPSG